MQPITTTLGIPTTIFSGFLGSGKTTIIGHLIDELQLQGEQVIYIKNEIGEENIDNQLLAGKHVVSRELLNGCICCTLVGPFVSAIDEIADSFQPDRIIIEASGAADPSAIALMISAHPKLYRDGVISIVDVVNFKGYTDLSVTARRQAQFTDLIVFNKIELVDLTHKRAVVGYVREFNEHAPIVEAPAGRVNPDVVFGISSSSLEALLQHDRDTHHEHATHTASAEHNHSEHLAADGIETFHLTAQGTAIQESIAAFLNTLPAQVFRVKGFFVAPDASISIAHKVGLRVDILPAPSETARENSFVFIGFHIAELKPEVTAQFTELFQGILPS
jgi:G3E family GTPase